MPLRRAAQGPAREELGRAARHPRRPQDDRTDLHEGTSRFCEKPGATPGRNARATRIGEPTHRHHHRRASFRSHTTMTDPSNDRTPTPTPNLDPPVTTSEPSEGAEP